MLSAFETERTAWYGHAVTVERDSDGDLLRRIAGGGPGAAPAEGVLCRRFAPRIRLYGLRHLRSPDRARDLTQSVLLGLLEAARSGRIREPDHVDRFVLGTCRHFVQRMKHADHRTLPLPEDEISRVTGVVEPRPFDTAALLRCLSALEQRAQRVVLLSYTEDLAADEIARRLETTAGNVRVLRHRALASLRRCLEGGGA